MNPSINLRNDPTVNLKKKILSRAELGGAGKVVKKVKDTGKNAKKNKKSK